MSCQETREAMKNPGKVEKHKRLRLLHHLRTCRECRSEIPAQERALTIHAVIMLEEEEEE